jgi:hypothetical protein
VTVRVNPGVICHVWNLSLGRILRDANQRNTLRYLARTPYPRACLHTKFLSTGKEVKSRVTLPVASPIALPLETMKTPRFVPCFWGQVLVSGWDSMRFTQFFLSSRGWPVASRATRFPGSSTSRIALRLNPLSIREPRQSGQSPRESGLRVGLSDGACCRLKGSDSLLRRARECSTIVS